MHLGKNGEIVPDLPGERDFMFRALTHGVDPKDRYPKIPSALDEEQARLVEHLENGPRSGDNAIVRGLSRMTISNSRDRAQAIEWLTILSEAAVNKQTPLF